jgi:hypothetical protein
MMLSGSDSKMSSMTCSNLFKAIPISTGPIKKSPFHPAMVMGVDHGGFLLTLEGTTYSKQERCVHLLKQVKINNRYITS